MFTKSSTAEQLKEKFALRNLSLKDIYSSHNFLKKCIVESEDTDIFSKIIHDNNVKLKQLETITKNIVVNSKSSFVNEEHTEQYNKTRYGVRQLLMQFKKFCPKQTEFKKLKC